MSEHRKMNVKFGTFSKYFIVCIYSLFFLYLLGLIGMQEKDPSTVDAMLWGILMALMGIAIGTVLIGFGYSEVTSGYEDLTDGILYSLMALAVMFVLNYLFVLGQGAYSLIGDASVLTKGERLLASLTAAVNEELFFRFALQRILQAKLPDNPLGWSVAVIPVAAMFSSYHIFVYGSQGITAFVYLFLLGCAAGYGLAVTKRFSVPLLVHIENNALATFWGG